MNKTYSTRRTVSGYSFDDKGQRIGDVQKEWLLKLIEDGGWPETG